MSAGGTRFAPEIRRMDELSHNSTPGDAVIERVPIRTLALTIVASIATLFALKVGAALLAPLLVSVLLAYALEPAVALLTRCRLSRRAYSKAKRTIRSAAVRVTIRRLSTTPGTTSCSWPE